MPEIIGVAARGDGVTADGRHVPLAAPGDRLRPDGALRRGPHHREPPCRHFPECGGCQLQHLDDESWARFLTDRIASALAQHGLASEIRAPHLSPPKTRRRATLHAERRGRQVHLGFTQGGSHALVDLMECQVMLPELFALLQPLRGLLASLLPKTGRSDVHLVSTDQGVDVTIGRVSADNLSAIEALTAFAQRHGLARLALDEGMGPEPRWEPEPATITLGGVPVAFPEGAFLQATEDGEAALVGAVREVAGSPDAVADLFAGLGTFAFAFPDAKIYAAEAARDAVMALKTAANMARRQVFADHRDLYRRPVSAEDLGRFDAIVLDPPRAGAKEQARQIASASAPKVAYVSCNPSTFARDAQLLCEGGYNLDWVQPVGQFRWSTHVELAACFSRQSG
ncbi:class I SAM-dependent RNA methyltransferase [Stakelama sp. CBK3Z-3]|uniref:Class I SAM-dependent RNA methyltransferase n=2 Tax=Stakelama flava TaxID=2860338 RepID=A0ABS6XRK7_9SPHN|nr:class I SAM-dependent RNA methyltransferase [Stakelama flava]